MNVGHKNTNGSALVVGTVRTHFLSRYPVPATFLIIAVSKNLFFFCGLLQEISLKNGHEYLHEHSLVTFLEKQKKNSQISAGPNAEPGIHRGITALCLCGATPMHKNGERGCHLTTRT